MSPGILATILLILLAPVLLPTAATAATFSIDNTFDDHDVNPGNGVCATAFGDCSLRAAVEEANAHPGLDSIQFGIAGTLTLSASQGELPAITGPLDIDGTTAPGYVGPSIQLENAPPKVYLNGQFVGGAGGSARGLRFVGNAASGSGVRAIGVVRFGTGISIGTGVNSLLVDSCYVGVLADGSAAGNGQGIFIGSDSNFIGRFASGFFGNVISANIDSGISLGVATNNVIAGNRIGTTPAGIGARGNGVGILGFAANNNVIGTFNSANDYGNVISGNSGDAIRIAGSGNRIVANSIGIAVNGSARGNAGIGITLIGDGNTVGSTDTNGYNEVANNTVGIAIDGDGNEIAGNRVGVAAFSQGNAGDGIRIAGGSNNVVTSNQVLNSGADGIDVGGDSTEVTSNTIGFLDFAVGGITNFGNDGSGIHLHSSNSTIGFGGAGNSIGFSGGDGIRVEGNGSGISGNFIGVTADGRNIGNDLDGVAILGIGSAASVVANSIAFNGGNGVVLVDSGNGSAIYSNSIFSNVGIGIDLLGDGPTPNDSGDADVGPNKLQNYPVVLAATFNPAAIPPQLALEWTIDSATSNSAYAIYADFYLADSEGSGEGATYIGSDFAIAPNVATLKSFNLPIGTTGGHLVMTATDGGGIGSTSEFSPPMAFGISDTIFADGFDGP